jgi:hypothetical protein
MYSDIPFSHVVLLSSVCPFQVSEAEDPFGFKGVQCCLFSARNTDPKNFTDPEKFSANVEAAFAISRQLFGFFPSAKFSRQVVHAATAHPCATSLFAQNMTAEPLEHD